MKKRIFIIDAGHGGIINGEYVTSGKRSPEFDGVVMYEGEFNRAVAEELARKLKEQEIAHVYIDSNLDISLTERVIFYNSFKLRYPDHECVLISIHANAASVESAKGIEVFTSPGQTNSDKYAEIWFNRFKGYFGDEYLYRTDTKDGDHDKEERFYVITQTVFPAFLIEHGFMTNKAECEKLKDEFYRTRFADIINESILEIIQLP